MVTGFDELARALRSYTTPAGCDTTIGLSINFSPFYFYIPINHFTINFTARMSLSGVDETINPTPKPISILTKIPLFS